LKSQLSQTYQQEFDELEQCMQLDLSSWKNHKDRRVDKIEREVLNVDSGNR
jgi:hypothetical protein